MPRQLRTTGVETFLETSVLRVPGAFAPADALGIRELAWQHLARQGVSRRDPATWIPERFRGFGSLRQELPLARLRTPALRKVLDELLGRGKWRFPEQGGLLVGPPESPRKPWRIARKDWHWDAGHAGAWTPSEGLFLWCPLHAIPARCGGTLLLEGSRSLLGEFMAECEARSVWSTNQRFQTWHPYLRRLFGLDPADDPDEFLTPFIDDAGRRLQVSEVTGEPGDVVITDSGIVHRIPQHHGSEPRFILLLRVGLR